MVPHVRRRGLSVGERTRARALARSFAFSPQEAPKQACRAQSSASPTTTPHFFNLSLV
jgi:hypothetical protein